MTSPNQKICKNLPDFSSGRFLLFSYCFSRPIVDAAKFHNVGVTQRHQLFRCLLAAVSAAAVDQDQLIFIRQFGNFLCPDGFIGDVDGTGNVFFAEFLRCADI